MIRMIEVSKSFGTQQVIQPTTLEMERGKTTVLIGPSGCGKSTLLRMIVGLIDPSSGTIEVDGTPLTKGNLQEVRRKMGFVFQDGGLFPHLTTEGNVSLLARTLKWDESKIRERVQELSELTRLPEGAMNKYPSQLSGGQRQRVAMMRGLMLDPPLILLDEPMGALDPLVRYDLQEDLKKIFERLRKTVVLVTHDMGEAGFLGDRVVLLGQGRIVQSGSYRDLIDRPADEFVKKYLQAQRLAL